MRSTSTIAILIVSLSASIIRAQEAGPALDSIEKQASYGIGLNIGGDLAAEGISVDLDAFLIGFKDAMEGKEPRIEREALAKALEQYQKDVSQRLAAERKALGEKNKTDGATFLARNGKREGVVTLPSGLQYQVVTEGNGPVPKATDVVRTHYRGVLLTGKTFDSSLERGEPAEFPVSGVIKGWVEALQLMKVGSKWKLYIPSDLAYGERGNPRGGIGPNAVLVFEIELLGIVEQEPGTENAPAP